MVVKEIRELFKGNKITNYIPSLSDMLAITKYVTVDTQPYNEGAEYLFKIDIIELSKSGIEDDTLNNMVLDGWGLSKDMKSIIKIY